MADGFLLRAAIDLGPVRREVAQTVAEIQSQVAKLAGSVSLSKPAAGRRFEELQVQAGAGLSSLEQAGVPAAEVAAARAAISDLFKLLRVELTRTTGAAAKDLPLLTQAQLTKRVEDRRQIVQTPVVERSPGGVISGVEAARLGDPQEAAQLAIERRQQLAATSEILSVEAEYINATTDLIRAYRTIHAMAQGQLAADEEYVTATQILTEARARTAALVNTNLAGSSSFIRDKSTSAIAGAQIRAGVAAETVGDPRLIQARQTLASANLQMAAQLAEERASSGLLIRENVRTATAREQQKSVETQALNANEQFIEATRVAAVARRRITLERQAGQLGINQGTTQQLTDTELRQLVIERQRLRTLEERAALSEATLQNEAGLFTAGVEAKAATQRLALETERAATSARLNAANAREAGLFQRASARIAQRPGEPPIDPRTQRTFGQAVQGAFLTTARFAVSGALIYGATAGIGQIVKQAADLEKILNQVRAQFRALGQSKDFEGFRNDILATARATGEAATDVASVAFQMKGAFGDTATAVKATNDAIKITRVTGLALNEVVDSLTAASLSFNVSIEEIGDRALAVQEKTGVLAKQTITAIADLAPVAKETGLTISQAFALIGAAQQVSGRSGSALAENFNRLLPNISKSSVEIANLYRTTPALAGGFQQVAKAIGQGQLGQVLDRLIRDWRLLSDTQQDQVISLVGGKREAQDFIAVLNNQTKYVELSAKGFQNAGKLQSYFASLQDTVSQRLARLRQELAQIGESLFRAGLSDALKDLIAVGGGVLTVFGGLARAAASFNEALGGMPAKLLLIVAALRGLQALYATGIFRGGAGVTGQLTLSGLGQAGLFAGLFGNLRGRIGASQQAYQGAVQNAQLAGASGIGQSAVGLGAGAGALFAGFNPYIIGTAVAIGGYQAIASKNRADAEKFATKIKDQDKVNAEALKEVAKKHASTWQALFRAFTGQQTDQQIAQTEVRTQAAQQNADKVALLEALKGTATGAKGPTQADIIGKLPPGSLGFYTGKNGQPAAGSLISPIGTKLDPKYIDKLIVAYKAGAEGSSQIVDAIIAAINGTAEGRAALDKALSDLKTRAASDRFNINPDTGTSTEQNTIEGIKEQVAAGTKNIQFLIDALKGSIATIELIGKSSGTLDSDKANQLAGFIKDLNQAYSDRARGLLDANRSVREAAGTNTPEQDVAELTNLLKDPNFQDPQGIAKAAADLAAAEKAILQNRIDLAKTATEKLRIAEEGIPFAAEARSAVLQVALTQFSAQWQQFLNIAQFDMVASVNITKQAVELVVQGGLTVQQAMIKVIQTQIDNLTNIALTLASAGEDASRVIDEVNRLNALKDSIATQGADVQTPPAKIGVDPNQQKSLDENKRKEARDIAVARLNLAKAQSRDPVEQAKIEVEIADTELKFAETDLERLQAQAHQAEARKALDQARLDITLAQLELDKARSAADPVKLARIALRQADIMAADAAKAKDVKAQLNAAASRIAAEKDLATAVLDVFVAQEELLQGLATIAGDTVAAAQIGLSIVRKQLNEAIKNVQLAGGDPNQNAEVLRLQLQLRNAEDQVRETDFQKKLGDIDFFLELQQITTSQAIAQLQALLAIANPEETRQILLKIKGLKDSLGQDLQFNLPSSLILPTLYEARRLNQGFQQGQPTYQDNRNVVVYMNVTNGMDQAAAADWLGGVIGQGVRVVGVGEKRY